MAGSATSAAIVSPEGRHRTTHHHGGTVGKHTTCAKQTHLRHTFTAVDAIVFFLTLRVSEEHACVSQQQLQSITLSESDHRSQFTPANTCRAGVRNLLHLLRYCLLYMGHAARTVCFSMTTWSCTIAVAGPCMHSQARPGEPGAPGLHV